MSLEPILQSSLAIQIHIATAFIALALGIVMYRRKKGTKSHKMVGRVFVMFMLATAISAIFIRNLNSGNFSWIHVFVPVTFIGAFQAIFWIRRGNIKKHKSAVSGMFFGALLIPGFLSFIPGRTMWQVFFG